MRLKLIGIYSALALADMILLLMVVLSGWHVLFGDQQMTLLTEVLILVVVIRSIDLVGEFWWATVHRFVKADEEQERRESQ